MAFVDEIVISAKAGNGGDGVVRWLHLKGKQFGGPAGGNGGKGGDVVMVGSRDLNILTRYKGRGQFKAEDGHPGFKNEMEGKNGMDVVIEVPIGSKITVHETEESFEVLSEGERVIVFSGGSGGLGNAHFKSSTNQYPDRATKGVIADSGLLDIEVQLIADVGFVGLPNAGKSSIMNTLTKARSKVAAYPFTTLEPSLGVFHTYILADIPGLIEGASEGKGLGYKFLRHIKRTKTILHCVSSEHENPSRIYEKVRKELQNYDPSLLEKPEIIFLTKTDLLDKEQIFQKKKELEQFAPVVLFSIIDDELIKNGGRCFK